MTKQTQDDQATTEEASDPFEAIAVGLFDIAAAIREHTAAIMAPIDEETGAPEIPQQYLDGRPIDG